MTKDLELKRDELKNALPEIIELENVRPKWTNFEGSNNDGFNEKLQRYFHIDIDVDVAKQLEVMGINVKWPVPNPEISPEDDRRLPSIHVRVSNNNNQPLNPSSLRVYLHSNGSTNVIDVSDPAALARLDKVYMDSCDVILKPFVWTYPPTKKVGVTLYLSVGHFTMAAPRVEIVDKFAEKYNTPNENIESDGLPF